MSAAFSRLAFTDAVQQLQTEAGSRAAYARQLVAHPDDGATLTPDAAAFISERDSFYMATVGATGWPYVQHRGGPPGFVHVLDPSTLGFADLRGNRQYVTIGNLAGDDRVALIFVDYPARARLKLLGRARIVGADQPELIGRLAPPPGDRDGARVERAIVIAVEAIDWNCSQHITERFTLGDVERAVAPLHRRIAELEARR
jgi:predicted pyridoxine 5'-phosphate oxidase superfamily flavin-nucleotide-binding protein